MRSNVILLLIISHLVGSVAFFSSDKKEDNVRPADTENQTPDDSEENSEVPRPHDPFYDTFGPEAVHVAASRGDIDELRFLLSQNIDINLKDANGWQPIHEAVKLGDVHTVRFLVENGAEVDQITAVGGTPLWWSKKQFAEDHPITEYLVSIGAPSIGEEIPDEDNGALDLGEITEGSTELHIAAAEGNIDDAKDILVNNPHLLNAQDRNGWQPIHEAVHAGHLEMVKFLVEQGSSLDVMTSHGGTPLWWARRTLGFHHPIIVYLESIRAPDEGIEF